MASDNVRRNTWLRRNKPVTHDLTHLPDGRPVEFVPDIDPQHQYYCDLYGADPAGFVHDMIEWARPYSFIAHQTAPYKWQQEILDDMTARLAVDDSMYRVAVSSGKGCGKTALLAQLFLWHIMTHRHSVTMLLGPTGDSLDSKMWAEIGRWYNVCKLRQYFKKYQGGKIQHVWHDDWRGQYQLWQRSNFEPIHGAHGQYLGFFLDETTGIANEVIRTIESGFLNDPHITMCCISNPTRLSSRFRQYFPGGNLAASWQTWHIDVRDTERHNPARVAELLEECHDDADDPWFRINVRGLFPLVDADQYITDAQIEDAQKRFTSLQGNETLDIGVDVARMGQNKTVFMARLGATILTKKVYGKREITETADLLMEFMDSLKHYKPKAYIDVVGYGAGVHDILKRNKYTVFEVNSALPATGPLADRYENRRMELLSYTKDWIMKDGCLDPKDRVLAKQLTDFSVFVNHRGKLQVESKEDMQSRGVMSPDEGDAMAYSFGGKNAYKHAGTFRMLY